MGYATYATGDRGIVRQREYRTLIGSELVAAVIVDGVPTSWWRQMLIGTVVEKTREIVGLSKADAHNTGTVTLADGSSVTLSCATTFTGGENPLETYSREIERTPVMGTKFWTLRISERVTNYEVEL